MHQVVQKHHLQIIPTKFCGENSTLNRKATALKTLKVSFDFKLNPQQIKATLKTNYRPDGKNSKIPQRGLKTNEDSL